jgi:hypothetical protein
MEWLYGDFEACPIELALPVNAGFKDIVCPLDPATNDIYGPSQP